MENILNQNTGVLLGSGTKKLWIGGTIPYEEILPSGDWRPFLPIGEKQKNPTETMACVTFSGLSGLEIQEIHQTGKEPNWSDRFIAKLSETTQQGNYLDKVADTIRLYGLVKEEEWPAPANYTWNSYYAPIPPEVINKAVKKDVAYEEIRGDKATLIRHLKQAPLQIIITNDSPNHAVTLVHLEGNTAYYFDSYSPYLKTIDVSKIYNYALKIVLKGQTMIEIVNDNGTYFVVGNKGKLGINGEDGLAFWRQLTDKERTGSTAGIPQIGTWEKNFGVDLD